MPTTGQTRAPQPPLPPPQQAKDPSSPASTSTPRRHRTFSSSSSSSLSTASSSASSPPPSPRGRGVTSVPFSWEHHPGIPKTRFPAVAGTTVAMATSPSPPTPLPLPPPLRAPPSSRAPRHHHHHQRTRRRRASSQPPADAADPFAAALAECTRERAAAGPADDRRLMDSLFPSPATASGSSCAPSRRWSIAASTGGVVGLLDLYGCKSAMGVAEGAAFVVRRPVAVVRPGPGRAGLGRAGRR
ncbi:hypothetical protein BAE44_0003764 [Dichanthelium oligosanthes]|uniref:Uncharacterized protein n=1 Tax=Dichanthelium oligosanthes TaxID=888268 RepID=A0A1E5WCV2_9POAL|nr:hypothetical protein BAE44_0003764 [Dichanthelium oligosanthes]